MKKMNQTNVEDFIVQLKEQNRVQKNNQELKALVIDDEENVAKSIGRVFSNKGIKVLLAHNGFSAGMILSNEKPKIVTLDLKMEQLSGQDVLKIIAALNLNEKIWVIVISGETEEHLIKAVNSGADFYLKKPFSKDDLEKIIDKLAS